MKRKWLWGSGGVLLLVVPALWIFYAGRVPPAQVQVETVKRRAKLVSKVMATGEIRPKEYVELQAEIAGVITELHVQEGSSVQKGDLLLKIDPTQTESDFRAQRAVLEMALAELESARSQISLQKSNVERDRANQRLLEVELERAREILEIAQRTFARKQELFELNLIAEEVYDAARNDLITARANLATAEARLEQARAQLAASELLLEQVHNSYQSAQSRVEQNRALLHRYRDLLSKTVLRSPLTGMVTQLNVEVGERAVPGTLNNPAATLMVIADMSVIEAEVEVDETDIINVRTGQPAAVRVDALREVSLAGLVTEVGSSAVQRSGQQEAKNFKVAIQLLDPPSSLRPGLSCTAEITTATREQVLTVPIQALTVREYPVGENGEPRLDAAETLEGDAGTTQPQEFTGVFVVKDGVAHFRPVQTGISGQTEIEVTEGLQEGDQIVVGSYRTLRTLRHGDKVEIEKKT